MKKHIENGIKTARNVIALVISRFLIHKVEWRKQYIENSPGRIALKISPDFLDWASEGVSSIVVTGTNGKTTTARMISGILNEAGIDFFSNREGANLAMRVATLYAKNYIYMKGPKTKLSLIELDEGNLPEVLPAIHPELLIVTNIFPDQQSRFTSEEEVCQMLLDAMEKAKPARCIIHRNCHFKEKIKKVKGWQFIEYETENEMIRIYNQLYSLQMKLPGRFNLENAAGAAKLGEQLKLPINAILQGIRETQPAFGRFESFSSGENDVVLCLAKNTQGFCVIADDIINLRNKQQRQQRHKKATNLILAMNTGDGDDKNTDWLYQIPVGKISEAYEEISVTGDCAELLGKLLDKAHRDPSIIRFDEIPAVTAQAQGGTFIIANYSAMMQIRLRFVKQGVLQPYWEV